MKGQREEAETRLRWALIQALVEFHTIKQFEEDAFSDEVRVAMQPDLFMEILSAEIVWRVVSNSDCPTIKVAGLWFVQYNSLHLIYRGNGPHRAWGRVFLNEHSAHSAGICCLADVGFSLDDRYYKEWVAAGSPE
jgi:hypothetical protein